MNLPISHSVWQCYISVFSHNVWLWLRGISSVWLVDPCPWPNADDQHGLVLLPAGKGQKGQGSPKVSDPSQGQKHKGQGSPKINDPSQRSKTQRPRIPWSKWSLTRSNTQRSKISWSKGEVIPQVKNTEVKNLLKCLIKVKNLLM